MDNRKKLYCVANAHLDTQWLWTIQDTIRDCVKNTLEKNFDLFAKYRYSFIYACFNIVQYRRHDFT